MTTCYDLPEGAYPGMPKIPRWSRNIIITEKIDGTNGLIYVPDLPGEPVRFGSKSQWLSTKNDNHGFYNFMAPHAELLRELLGPGIHRGEWWGSGIQRGYGLPRGEKRFSLFNTNRWMTLGWDGGSGPVLRAHWKHPSLVPPPWLQCVPVLLHGQENCDRTITTAIELLTEEGSHVVTGFKNPEGIVIYHTAGNVMFKKTLHHDEISKEELANRELMLRRNKEMGR